MKAFGGTTKMQSVSDGDDVPEMPELHITSYLLCISDRQTYILHDRPSVGTKFQRSRKPKTTLHPEADDMFEICRPAHRRWNTDAGRQFLAVRKRELDT